MNKYQKDLIKFVYSNNNVSIWSLIANELKDSTWLDRHILKLQKEENKGLPFTLKLSCPISKRHQWKLMVSKISYNLSRVITNLDVLVDQGYLVPTQPFNLEIPEGETLFSIGTLSDPSDGYLIYPDINITQKLIQRSNSEYILSEDAKEFIANDYKTTDEIKFEKSSRLTQGILNANKIGLGLALCTLIVSGLSICTSKNASTKTNDSLDSLNVSAGNLKSNLDSINNSFNGITDIVSILDSSLLKSIETVEKGYKGVDESLGSLNKSLENATTASNKLNQSADKFNETLKKINYQYDRKAIIKIGVAECVNDSTGIYIHDFVISNTGNLYADIKSIALAFPKNSKAKYLPEVLKYDVDGSNEKIDKYRYDFHDKNFKLNPNQPSRIEGKIKLSSADLVERVKVYISYFNSNESKSISQDLIIKCKSR